ncbi:MAG: M20 family metallopeptidase [Chryseolinea sp.]
MANAACDRIKKLAEVQHSACVSWMRAIHEYPELSYHEHGTAKYIRGILESNGFETISTIGDTGVVTTINGKGVGRKKTIMLRADIDALAIPEENDLPFKSQNAGVMHACGHDAHTAMLLSACSILSAISDEWSGTIKILFQPAEEISPGGALKMIAGGVLESPKVEEAIGQHVMPRLATGKVGIRAGRFMASSDDFTIIIHGKGGHAAMPENLIDPVLIAGHLIVALQQVVSRQSNPKTPSVLSIGNVEAAGTFNVVPDRVTMKGTFRTLDIIWREKALQQIEKLSMELSASMGARATVEFKRGYPYLQNDEPLALDIKKSIVQYVGNENVIDEDIWMAAEDFAYYSHNVPSVFYLLGVRNEAKGIISGLHTPAFMVDEDALQLGAGLMAWIAYERMQ